MSIFVMIFLLSLPAGNYSSKSQLNVNTLTSQFKMHLFVTGHLSD